MKIVNTFPPNIEMIREKIGNPPSTAVFTYGDTIYNPSHGFIDSYLITHEETHERQQGDKPEDWWSRYYDDKQFRLDQELEAYRNQYRHFCRNKKNPQKEAMFLEFIAHHLSSEMYGDIVTKEEAKGLICQK